MTNIFKGRHFLAEKDFTRAELEWLIESFTDRDLSVSIWKSLANTSTSNNNEIVVIKYVFFICT
jgi:hypothetical protein